MRKSRPLAAAVLASVLLAAACSGTSGKQASNKSAGKASLDQSGGTAGRVATVASVPKGQPADITPSIVYTAKLEVRVKHPERAAAEAVSVVEGMGGRLFKQASQSTDDADQTITFKVPPQRFRKALDSLARLGEMQRKDVSTEDVTDQVVDLQGRLGTATASANRLRKLLSNAPAVPEIVAIETELAKREAEVESLTGQLRVVRSRVALSTIDLTLTRRHEAAVDKHIPGFLRGLHTGWIAFVNFLAVLVTAVGLALPFLLLAAPAFVLFRLWRRRRDTEAGPTRRRDRPRPAPGWPVPPPPATAGPADP